MVLRAKALSNDKKPLEIKCVVIRTFKNQNLVQMWSEETTCIPLKITESLRRLTCCSLQKWDDPYRSQREPEKEMQRRMKTYPMRWPSRSVHIDPTGWSDRLWPRHTSKRFFSGISKVIQTSLGFRVLVQKSCWPWKCESRSVNSCECLSILTL